MESREREAFAVNHLNSRTYLQPACPFISRYGSSQIANLLSAAPSAYKIAEFTVKQSYPNVAARLVSHVVFARAVKEKIQIRRNL